MADDVVLEVERSDSHAVIRASGFLDVATSPRLREQLTVLAAESPAAVILDLESVEFLDSSALGVILNGWKKLQASGSRLAVVSPQPRITKIFEITALNLSIDLYASMQEAIADLGP